MVDITNIPIVIDEVEKDLLAEIVENLKRNQLDQVKAQALAKEFLVLLPPKDFSDMVRILKSLSTEYREARDVYVKYEAIQQELNDQNKATLMAQHIASGNIEKAIEIAKGGQNA